MAISDNPTDAEIHKLLDQMVLCLVRRGTSSGKRILEGKRWTADCFCRVWKDQLHTFRFGGDEVYILSNVSGNDQWRLIHDR